MFKNKNITKKMIVIALSVLILANATGIQFGFANEYEEAPLVAERMFPRLSFISDFELMWFTWIPDPECITDDCGHEYWHVHTIIEGTTLIPTNAIDDKLSGWIISVEPHGDGFILPLDTTSVEIITGRGIINSVDNVRSGSGENFGEIQADTLPFELGSELFIFGQVGNWLAVNPEQLNSYASLWVHIDDITVTLETNWNGNQTSGGDNSQGTEEISIDDIDYIIFDFSFRENWYPAPAIEGATAAVFNSLTQELISPVNDPGVSDANGNLQVVVPALPGVQRLTTYETAPGRDFSSRTLDFYPSFPVGSSVSTDDEGNTFLTVTVIGILNPIPGDYTPDGDDNQDTGSEASGGDDNQDNGNATPDADDNQDTGDEQENDNDNQNRNQTEAGNDASERAPLPEAGANTLNVAVLGFVSANIGIVTAVMRNKKKKI